MRLIDLNNAISELRNLPEQERLEYMGVYDLLKSMPTIEAEPVVHGHWKPIYVKPELRHLVCGNSECSVCGKFGFDHFIRCGYCGAKMDEEQKCET